MLAVNMPNDLCIQFIYKLIKVPINLTRKTREEEANNKNQKIKIFEVKLSNLPIKGRQIR